MAPPVTSIHPDQTDSEEEKKESTNPTKSVQEGKEQALISTFSAEGSENVASTVSATTILANDSKNDEKSVADRSSDIVLDAAPAPVTYTHPWDGPPAKEPVYPPGTYHTMAGYKNLCT